MEAAPSDGPRHLVLVGLMGAGKTSVGERAAARLGRAFVDTDNLVEATAHLSVAEIFDSLGESRFRELERDAVADVSASPDPLVIACGGGAVLDAASRARLRATGVVVWLQAPAAELSERVESATTTERPLLRGGAAVSTLERLAAVRAPRTRLPHTWWSTRRADRSTTSPHSSSTRTPASSMRWAADAMERVTVALPDPYDVLVGPGALGDAGTVLADRRKVAIVSQSGVADFHAPTRDRRAADRRRRHRRVPHGRRRTGEDAQHRRRALPRASPNGVSCVATLWLPSVAGWSATPPDLLLPSTTGASRWCRRRPRCSRRSTRPSAGRPP